MYWDRVRDTVYGSVLSLIFIMGVISLCRATWVSQDAVRLEAEIREIEKRERQSKVHLQKSQEVLRRTSVMLEQMSSRLDRIESFIRQSIP